MPLSILHLFLFSVSYLLLAIFSASQSFLSRVSSSLIFPIDLNSIVLFPHSFISRSLPFWRPFCEEESLLLAVDPIAQVFPSILLFRNCLLCDSFTQTRDVYVLFHSQVIRPIKTILFSSISFNFISPRRCGDIWWYRINNKEKEREGEKISVSKNKYLKRTVK